MEGWKDSLSDSKKEGEWSRRSCTAPLWGELWVKGRKEGITRWQRDGEREGGRERNRDGERGMADEEK